MKAVWVDNFPQNAIEEISAKFYQISLETIKVDFERDEKFNSQIIFCKGSCVIPLNLNRWSNLSKFNQFVS